jgi:hypothetical protein
MENGEVVFIDGLGSISGASGVCVCFRGILKKIRNGFTGLTRFR